MSTWSPVNRNKGDRGVLCPIFSIGGFGKDAYKFVDFLASIHQSYWQVLPLCPRDDKGSPYNSPASMEIDKAYGTEMAWFKLKKYANQKDIKIIGDMPFFVSTGSKECKADKNLFLTDQFSGVPPDSYNRRWGQYWGQYQYNWEKLEATGFKFILDRFRNVLKLYDMVRLDHFRGYQAVWSIPKGYRSGRKGKWVLVPGEKLFKAVQQEFKTLPFIAEDLGRITEDVERLRKEFHFLGTKIVQWSKTVPDDVAYYTGNHDTPTLVGLVGKRKAAKLISHVRNSNAVIKIITISDLLGLDNKSRINRPGGDDHNWCWKLNANSLNSIDKVFPNNQLASWL